MKHILITGINSYVGNSLAYWLGQYPDDYSIDKISLKDDAWRNEDFSKYDVIVHVAGIAHRKETKKNKHLYYKVNRDVTVEIAKKAKKEYVSQFIFLSSMSVYGKSEGVIDENTSLQPTSHYGNSKLQAESQIESLDDEAFKVAIVRPPMIYGKGCKGNYQKLRKLALNVPIFPDINNKRSMIYIDNLNMFIESLIDKKKKGIYCPQNTQSVNTSQMVKYISEVHNKSLLLTKIFNPVIKIMKAGALKKVFGNLVYAESYMKYHDIDTLNFIDFQTSIKLTED